MEHSFEPYRTWRSPATQLPYCPGCGCNLGGAGTVHYGNVEIDELGDIYLLGRKVPLARTQHELAAVLIRAKGRSLTRSLLASILDREINDSTISKYVERARASFARIDPAFDQIEAVHGLGCYRWNFQPELRAQTRITMPSEFSNEALIAIAN